MAKNITEKQLQNLNWLDTTGSSDYAIVQAKDLDAILLGYANRFKDELLINIQKKQITASGSLEKNIIIKTPYELNGKSTLDIYLPYYAKFVDKGVKGVLDDSNSPNSPYQFKNFGMSEDGIKNLKKYISQAKKKITASDVSKFKSTKQENKNKNIADTRLNTLIYLIKAYGIKTTNFYSNAVDKSFKGLEKNIADSIGVNIAVNITK
jgi:hypothetical protein